MTTIAFTGASGSIVFAGDAVRIDDSYRANWGSRAELSDAIAGGLVPVEGLTYYAEGLAYLGQPGATTIGDLPGLVPGESPLRGHFGLSEVLGVPCEAVASGGMSDAQSLRTTHKPLVIFCSGQSNMARRSVYSWQPPQNLRLWSYFGSGLNDAAATTTVGVWEPAPDDISNTAMFVGDYFASENPERPIYALGVSKGGLAISQWIIGAADPQMWTAIENNVPAALAGIAAETGWPVDKVDAFVWWQGESDAFSDPSGYADKFEDLHSQLRGETWFDHQTPVVICGLSPHGGNWAGALNAVLTGLVNADTDARIFTNPGAYPIEYWESVDNYVHMTPEGYRRAGHKIGRAVDVGSGGAAGVPDDLSISSLSVGGVSALTGGARSFSTVHPDNALRTFDMSQYGSRFSLLIFNCTSGSSADRPIGMVRVRCLGTPATGNISLPAAIIEFSTGPKSGTTGTDGKFVISPHSDGVLYLENRLGFTVEYSFLAIP